MNNEMHSTRLRPKLLSLDVFGTLISVRESSYSAFERIQDDAGAHWRPGKQQKLLLEPF
jgi:hypothetical protein